MSDGDSETNLNTMVTRRSTPEEKISLFRSLFKGREDVYPRRFENRTSGKSGYAPACANEWVRGVCEKPRIKCTKCSQQKFLPLTAQVIGWHLSGVDELGRDFVAGIYPMHLDETCCFIAMDLDKADWREDATAILETCRKWEVPASLERSRSGNGGHLWMFFEQAIPATLARRLGTTILTETMDRRPDIGLDSYDRLFPNQDTLPSGGLGNLIALPLQKKPRSVGNSVFVDQHFEPFPDQWEFLSSIRRISTSRVEALVSEATRNGRVVGVRMAADDEDDPEPWVKTTTRPISKWAIKETMPKKVELVLADMIYVDKHVLPPMLRNHWIRLAAFQNPEFYKAQAMRLPTFGKPRIIGCAEEHSRFIAIPRGCLSDALAFCSELGITAEVRDERCYGERLAVSFEGELRPSQWTAARKMLQHDTGVLAATTAFGKTVVAAWLIAQRQVNTLVLVHRRQLMDQWMDRLSTFLGVPSKSVGQIGGGRRKATGALDVAMIQSLVRRGTVDPQVASYGHLVVDECHHLSAVSFEQVVKRAKAKYVLGLSATVTRKDGHHPMVLMQCGAIRHRVDAKAEAVARPFEHTVHVRPTAFQSRGETDPDRRLHFQQLYAQLVADDVRNQMICDDALGCVHEGRSPLLLTERKEHLELLANQLKSKVRHLLVLQGGSSRTESRQIAQRLADIAPDHPRLLLATGRFIGEGFDDARLDTLLIALPVSWRGTIAQYVGRLHRLREGKREVRVYDYADLNVPMLARMFDRRCAGYEAIGYSIQLPGHAVPGWPVEVPLPIDAQWKGQYSCSVKRLVRDGVDAPLAKLFVHVARPFEADAEGTLRARSASEAFLFRRLASLPELEGRFQLNAELPILFDGRGNMEVDLLCASIRLVIELDGPQHLGCEDAYRRDRRKDALLQEHGYFVLRFLATDIGKNLDLVLDTILRAMNHRSRR